jgi:hypothetical protein
MTFIIYVLHMLRYGRYLYESDDMRSLRGVGMTIVLHIGELQGRHDG